MGSNKRFFCPEIANIPTETIIFNRKIQALRKYRCLNLGLPPTEKGVQTS
jgi:hypothetical protein